MEHFGVIVAIISDLHRFRNLCGAARFLGTSSYFSANRPLSVQTVERQSATLFDKKKATAHPYDKDVATLFSVTITVVEWFFNFKN